MKKLSQENDDDESDSSEDDDGGEAKEAHTSSIDFKKRSSNAELELLDESMTTAHSSTSSSSDDSFTTNETATTTKTASHFCSYFQQESTHSTSGCKHTMVIGQNVCLQCEFGRELSDSLDHMAFLSPQMKATRQVSANKFGHDILRFQG